MQRVFAGCDNTRDQKNEPIVSLEVAYFDSKGVRSRLEAWEAGLSFGARFRLILRTAIQPVPTAWISCSI